VHADLPGEAFHVGTFADVVEAFAHARERDRGWNLRSAVVEETGEQRGERRLGHVTVAAPQRGREPQSRQRRRPVVDPAPGSERFRRRTDAANERIRQDRGDDARARGAEARFVDEVRGLEPHASDGARLHRPSVAFGEVPEDHDAQAATAVRVRFHPVSGRVSVQVRAQCSHVEEYVLSAWWVAPTVLLLPRGAGDDRVGVPRVVTPWAPC
jgi:hypothetical protein